MMPPLSAPRSARTTGMSSLTVDLVARICDYLHVEENLRRICTNSAFKDAIEKVRVFECVKLDKLVLAHPLAFARFSGAHYVRMELCDPDDYTRFLAVACSSPRRWRALRIYFDSPEELKLHLMNLASAIRAGLLGELQYLSMDHFNSNDLVEDVHEALLRVCSALPARAAVRLMIDVGIGKEAILQRIDASPSLDLNETSPYLDPVAVTVATTILAMDLVGSEFVVEVPMLLRELKQRGLDFNCRRPDSHISALSLAIESFMSGEHVELGLNCAKTMLELGADPNGGFPPPLLVLCGAGLSLSSTVTGWSPSVLYDYARPRLLEDHVRFLDDLMLRGADPLATYDGKTAVDYLLAAQRGLIDGRDKPEAANVVGDMIRSVTRAMHAQATAAGRTNGR